MHAAADEHLLANVTNGCDQRRVPGQCAVEIDGAHLSCLLHRCFDLSVAGFGFVGRFECRRRVFALEVHKGLGQAIVHDRRGAGHCSSIKRNRTQSGFGCVLTVGQCRCHIVLHQVQSRLQRQQFSFQHALAVGDVVVEHRLCLVHAVAGQESRHEA